MSTDNDVNLTQLRISAKLSQEELAAQLRISQSQVSRHELDPDNTPHGIFKKWVEVCGEVSTRQPLEYGAPYQTIRTQIQLMSSYAEAAPADLDLTVFKDAPTAKNFLAQVRSLGRKPRIAICGRFDQGKSRLANTLMGRNHLPTGYQPATSLICLVRHAGDRPPWLKEDVWIMSEGFDLNKADDEDHCLKHKVVAGSFDTLKRYGTHHDDPPEDAECCTVALVYIDTPFLLGCDLLDLPGYGNSKSDHDKAELAHSIADALIYTSSATGFLDQNDLQFINVLLKQLPPIEMEDDAVCILQNVFFVATMARQSQDELDDIITTASTRAYKHLWEGIEARAELVGRPITSADFRKRFFSYLVDEPVRREPFEADLKHFLNSVFPARVRARLDICVASLKKSSKKYCDNWTGPLIEVLDNRDQANNALKLLERAEPNRRRRIDAKTQRIQDLISSSKRASSEYIDKELRLIVTPDAVEKIILNRYNDKKEAAQLAALYITDHVQNKLNTVMAEFANELTPEITAILADYQESGRIPNIAPGVVDIPFNAQGFFLGALAGGGTAGALAAWAAVAVAGSESLLVPGVVSLVSGLGISGGGSVAALSTVAALGGPVTVLVGLAVITSLAAYALFGSSWQRRLAKKICEILDKLGYLATLIRHSDKYWDDTRFGFEKGMEATEKAFQDNLKNLQTLVTVTSREEITTMIAQVEDARDFFGGIPWRAAS